MAISQQTLNNISNPTGGGLGRIAATYVNSKNAAAENRRAEEKAQQDKITADLARKVAQAGLDKTEMENLLNESKILSGVTTQYLTDVKKYPDIAADPKAYDQYMQRITQGLPEDVVNKFKGVLPSEFSKMRDSADMLVNVLSKAKDEKPYKLVSFNLDDQQYNFDANTQQEEIKTFLKQNPQAVKALADNVGSSEFERLQSIPEDQRTAAQQKRIEVLSGLGMRAGTEESLKLRQDIADKETTLKRRKEVGEGVKHFSEMSRNIDQAITAIGSSDTVLAQKYAAQAMSQMIDTNVRAYAMYKEFDQPFGNVVKRTVETIGQFLIGKKSEEHMQEVAKTLEYFRDKYALPGKKKVIQRYRGLARADGLDPLKVAPPESPMDIATEQTYSDDKKRRVIRQFYPSITAKQIAKMDIDVNEKKILLNLMYPGQFTDGSD